jgi:hypothetical protein
MLGLFENGIFLNPMGIQMDLSLAPSDEDLRKGLDISREVLKKLFRLSRTQGSSHSKKTIFRGLEITFKERSRDA